MVNFQHPTDRQLLVLLKKRTKLEKKIKIGAL